MVGVTGNDMDDMDTDKTCGRGTRAHVTRPGPAWDAGRAEWVIGMSGVDDLVHVDDGSGVGEIRHVRRACLTFG